MIRLILIPILLFAFVNPAPAHAQDTCYVDSWEFDAAYTYCNAVYSPGGSLADMPIEFTQATGSAFITFNNEGDFAYTFDSWSVTFRNNADSPISTEVQVNLQGDVWGRYVEADSDALTMFMSGSGVPEPNIDVSSVITVAGQSMDGPSGFENLFGPQTFLLAYRCEDGFLYVNSESAGGFFNNSRYMRAH